MKGDYELLGVEPTASIQEINSAYGKVLNDNHPNKNGNFDNVKVDKIMTAFKRITSKSPKETSLPSLNAVCDEMERKMNDMNLEKEDSFGEKKPYYSKLSYFVRRDGKVFTKIEENANGNKREYEEIRYE